MLLARLSAPLKAVAVKSQRSMSPDNVLSRAGLDLRARPSLASLGASERGRHA